MAVIALAAIGGCVQVVKTLYEYYSLHTRNKALLDILEGFSQNLEISIARLQVREELLTGTENAALDSIAKDFTNAQTWLVLNDKDLRSIWTALQAADKLQDLDDRLTKAFASKMSVAIFSALQDSREATTKIQTTLDGMQESLEVAVREASREGLHAAIQVLKEEAYQARGGGGATPGFHNGEAEKIISQLVDQLSAQELLREEEDARALEYAGYPPLNPDFLDDRTHSSSHPYLSSTHRTLSSGSSNAANSLFSREQGGRSGGSMTSFASQETRESRKGKAREGNVPAGSIVFSPLDPFTKEDLVDPVLANDGLIHDRWTLMNGSHVNVRDPAEPLLIVGDVVQLREAIFLSFPRRRLEFESKRQAYREKTMVLYEEGGHDALPDVINRLSHILLWEPTSVSLRVRRALARYRLRHLAEALEDLTKAIELSTRDVDGTPGTYEPDLDALRGRALVLEELHDNEAAMTDIQAVLGRSPDDILVLSLRGALRGNAGDLKGAQADLAATNRAITSDKAYRSRLGDSDADLDYVARGWAYVSITDFASANTDFSYSLGLRSGEPYTLACRGLALVNHGLSSGADDLVKSGLEDIDTSIQVISGFADTFLPKNQPLRPSSGITIPAVGTGEIPAHTFGCFFLLGIAYFGQQQFAKALSAFEQGILLRPSIVRDTGEFRFALAQLRAETGDREGARIDFDFAVALQPSERFVYSSTRESYGL